MNRDVIKKWLNIKFFELKLCLFKSKRTTNNVIKLIINKELLKFGVDYDYIVKNQKINNDIIYFLPHQNLFLRAIIVLQ